MKSHIKIFLIYCVPHKTSYGTKLLRVTFDKADACITKHDGTKYPALFYSDEKFDRIFNRIKHLIMMKRNNSDIYSHKYTKIKTSSDDDLHSEKTINILILFNENPVLVLKKIIAIIAILSF